MNTFTERESAAEVANTRRIEPLSRGLRSDQPRRCCANARPSRPHSLETPARSLATSHRHSSDAPTMENSGQGYNRGMAPVPAAERLSRKMTPSFRDASSGYRTPGVYLEGSTMYSAADLLSLPQSRNLLGRVVQDRTGLTGRYKMELEYQFTPQRPLDPTVPADSHNRHSSQQSEKSGLPGLNYFLPAAGSRMRLLNWISSMGAKIISISSPFSCKL